MCVLSQNIHCIFVFIFFFLIPKIINLSTGIRCKISYNANESTNVPAIANT